MRKNVLMGFVIQIIFIIAIIYFVFIYGIFDSSGNLGKDDEKLNESVQEGKESPNLNGENLEADAIQQSALQKVFDDYRNSIWNKDFEKYKNSSSSESLKKDEEFAAELGKEFDNAFFEESAEIIIKFIPEAKYVIIENKVISGDTATWTASEESPNHLDGNYVGIIEFVKEDGDWKVQEESWDVYADSS